MHVTYHGTICLVECDEAARQWVEEHVLEPMWHGSSLVVEPRYVQDLLAGYEGDA